MKVKATIDGILVAGFLIGTHVKAADLYYSATGSGYYSWDVASAWMIYGGGGPVGRLPGTNDEVRINATSPRAEDGHALTVTNGVFAECNTFASGYQNYPGTAWFRLDGGSLTCRTDFITGQNYPGLATLESGSLCVGTGFYVGYASGGKGVVTNTGAAVTAANISMGYVAGSSGRLVHGGGSLNTEGLLNVGRNGGIGAFEANAPFGVRIMIVGTGLAPNVPGTGTATVVEGAVGTVDEYLRVNNGSLFMRGGQIHLQNTGNPVRTNLYVRTGEDRCGQIRGWGYVGYTNENMTLRMINNGRIVADGEGEERDLDFNMIAVVNNDIPNGMTGTNGWYAVNKGCLRYPRTWQTYTPGTVYCWGDLYSKTSPEMVNSVGFGFTASVNCAIRGSLCSPDRSDIPAGLPARLRPLGVWQIGAFSGKLALTKVSFTGVLLTFRYDHTQVRATDRMLRLYRYDGSAWVQVGACEPGGDPLISTDASLAPVASGDYNIGWFAVMAADQHGTLISVQ